VLVKRLNAELDKMIEENKPKDKRIATFEKALKNY
jgi:hypothetical protein